MDRLMHLKARKDTRLVFRKDQNVAVHCLTDKYSFDGRIKNLSSSGIFISTDQQLPRGEEIAISFTFPDSGNSVKATGKVARVTHTGIGVEILVYFKDKDPMPNTPVTALKKQPKVIFLDGPTQSK